MARKFLAALRWFWRQFRRLPVIVQVCFGAACIGSLIMAIFVGNVGLALMGTAIGLSGPLIGAVMGVLIVILSWCSRIVIKAKRQIDESV